MPRRIRAFILALSLLPLPVPAQDLAERTDRIFARWNRTDSPGCALAVVRDGEVSYARGYGMADLEHGVPITPRTVFYAGSVSKQFVAACVALLEKAGRLSLDDPVRKHVPEFPDYGAPLTIRHLIHHTSGIRDYLELAMLAGRSYLDHLPAAAVLATICRQRELNFAPGARHLYSNSCYFLLGVVVERVSGESLRAFAARQLLDPLGMHDSRFHDDVDELIPERAAGYARDGSGRLRNRIMRFDLVGSGGLYTTVEDLAKWEAFFVDDRLGARRPDLAATLLTRGELADGTTIPYAFALVHGTHRGAATVGHSGALGGYRAMFLRFPAHRFAVAILGNVTDLDPETRAHEVADVFLGDVLAPAADDTAAGTRAGIAPAPAARPEAATAPELAAAVAGDYESVELDVRYHLRVVDGDLHVTVGDTDWQLRPTEAPDALAFDAGRLEFARDADGTVAGFRVSTNRVKNVRFVRLP